MYTFVLCIGIMIEHYSSCKELLLYHPRGQPIMIRYRNFIHFNLCIYDHKFQTESVQNRLYKSLKVWSMYADLEESLGTFDVSTFHTGSALNVSYIYIFLIPDNQGCL